MNALGYLDGQITSAYLNGRDETYRSLLSVRDKLIEDQDNLECKYLMADARESKSPPRESNMEGRFHRGRWSDTRKSIDAMEPLTTLQLPLSEYFNAKSSVDRLNDAYEDRAWRMSRKGRKLTVYRTK